MFRTVTPASRAVEAWREAAATPPLLLALPLLVLLRLPLWRCCCRPDSSYCRGGGGL